MTILVGVAGWDPARWAEGLGRALPDRTVLQTGRDGAFRGPENLSTVRYLLAWKPPQALLDSLPGLQVVFSLGAGVDHLMGLRLPPSVPIVRMVDPNMTGRMTEYVVWQVLHHHRQAFAYRAQQEQRVWKERPQPPASAVTVGVMGLGVLGGAAADVLGRIGFRVVGWSRSPKVVDGVETFHGRGQLDRFLGETDILVALLPFTPETAGILDRRLIDRLRRDGPLGGPVLINAGRGGSQVSADILQALRDGRLAGASLDVFETEPLPPDSPLWDAPNLVLTPHAAASSDPAALSRRIAEHIQAHERGEPLENQVDRARGY